MTQTTTSRLSWRFLVGFVVIAALAQACGGSSSNSTGSSASRPELRFSQVKGAVLGVLPQGCQSVELTIRPGNKTVSASNTTVSLLLPAGQYSISGILRCGGQSFPSDKPDPVFTVPPGLQSIDVALVFGGVNVTLSVQASGGVQVTGSGIACPGDCSESFFAGTSVKLTANKPDAVFSGGCTGTGSCVVFMNTDKTVFVSLTAVLDSFIRANVGTCCGALDIHIDGVLVAGEVPAGGSVTRKVSPGDHLVEGFPGAEPCDSQSVNVSPGETEVVTLSCD